VRTFDTQRRVFEEVTCATAVLDSPDTAAAEIMRVVEEVKRQCRPGYIEVPYDVVDMAIPKPIYITKKPETSDAEKLSAAIDDAVAMINNAHNPVIIADVELHRHGLTDIAVSIAEKFNIPIAATLLSKSVISEKNPLYIGVYSGAFSEPECQEAIEQSDCVIMLGAFITDVFLGLYTAQLRRKNIILATTEETKIGLRSYTKIQFKEFLEGLSNSLITKRPVFNNPVPAPRPFVLEEAEKNKAITVESFFAMLGEEMPEDATIVCDTGDALLGAIGLRTSGRSTFLSDAYYLSMGFAVPASIGAAVANPDSRQIVIVGDGAFQMTGIELSTVAKEQQNPIVCILNNDGYGTQRHILDGPFNKIHPWDYPKICELLCYGKAYKVKTKHELQRALQQSIASDEMALIEVIVPRDDCSRSLKRLGEELGKLRDKDKKG
jgi:indolepyruvate decarboxylase